MEPVIEPTIVWMVHLDRGTPDETEGTLSADEWELVFTDAASLETARFRFVDIVSVKRVLGSPVFTVGWRRDDETRRTAFYLTRPPPLGTLGSPGGPPNAHDLTVATPFRRSGRWRQRRENTRYLAATAVSSKDRRDALVTQIRAAMKQARGEAS
jgi:hypothetical protein